MFALHYSMIIGLSLILLGERPSKIRFVQIKGNSPSLEVPIDCENANAILEAAHHDAGKDGLIIVIARLGASESKRELNRRRLHNVRTFLTEHISEPDTRNVRTVILAEGEPVKGLGRVELYVKGKLYSVLLVGHNRDFHLGICFNEGQDTCLDKRQKNMYPCLKRNSTLRHLSKFR